jgi:hypothetical protein
MQYMRGPNSEVDRSYVPMNGGGAHSAPPNQVQVDHYRSQSQNLVGLPSRSIQHNQQGNQMQYMRGPNSEVDRSYVPMNGGAHSAPPNQVQVDHYRSQSQNLVGLPSRSNTINKEIKCNICAVLIRK